jgi:Lrp/AsnC family transcriptional regulator
MHGLIDQKLVLLCRQGGTLQITLTGEADYQLRIVVPDIETYDLVYQRMISRVEFSEISSAIAMEEMKYTTAIPTNYILVK